MINFLNLKYFVRVAEEGNITRVAEQEHISQQSLSAHIKKIEDEYGVLLFDRNGGFELTYAGEQMYLYATRFLSLKGDMENELADMTSTEQGSLRIGISYTRGAAFLPEILPEFCSRHSFIKISIVENNSQILEEHLLRGHIDLHIGADLRPHAEIETVHLSGEKLYFVVPKSLAEKIKMTEDEKGDIFKAPFLLLSRGNRIRDIFEEYLRVEKLSVKTVLECENIETLFELSCKGMGITLYPEMFLKRHKAILTDDAAPVAIFPFKGEEESVLSIGYHRSKYISAAARDFINIAREKCK